MERVTLTIEGDKKEITDMIGLILQSGISIRNMSTETSVRSEPDIRHSPKVLAGAISNTWKKYKDDPKARWKLNEHNHRILDPEGVAEAHGMALDTLLKGVWPRNSILAAAKMSHGQSVGAEKRKNGNH